MVSSESWESVVQSTCSRHLPCSSLYMLIWSYLSQLLRCPFISWVYKLQSIPYLCNSLLFKIARLSDKTIECTMRNGFSFYSRLHMLKFFVEEKIVSLTIISYRLRKFKYDILSPRIKGFCQWTTNVTQFVEIITKNYVFSFLKISRKLKKICNNKARYYEKSIMMRKCSLVDTIL